MNSTAEKWWRDEDTGDLELEVSGVPEACRFDGELHKIAAWKRVDFVFHWPNQRELWLVEIKDPDNPNVQSDPATLIEKFRSKDLIRNNLAPKAKDSFLYLLLQNQLPQGTRIIYLVLFACEQFKLEKRARYFRAAGDELKRCLGLPGPEGHAWPRACPYVDECLILSLSEWNHQVGSRVKVRRLSSIEAAH
ncbi:MAG: hypothetical protein IPM54_38545 [Polyangiaceae bacterium]|nr:hypothetical protein [Polyangiaceae bacterium]